MAAKPWVAQMCCKTNPRCEWCWKEDRGLERHGGSVRGCSYRGPVAPQTLPVTPQWSWEHGCSSGAEQPLQICTVSTALLISAKR